MFAEAGDNFECQFQQIRFVTGKTAYGSWFEQLDDKLHLGTDKPIGDEWAIDIAGHRCNVGTQRIVKPQRGKGVAIEFQLLGIREAGEAVEQLHHTAGRHNEWW